MKNETKEQNKADAYEKPKLEDHGSLAEHTQTGNFTGSPFDVGSS